LLEGHTPGAVLADKGYAADSILAAVQDLGAIAVIPPKANRKMSREYDGALYKERNLVERMFNKLKHFRRVATRYDKLASSFMGWLTIASIILWLK
jgi:transposase